jgi:hypothetical protein
LFDETPTRILTLMLTRTTRNTTSQAAEARRAANRVDSQREALAKRIAARDATYKIARVKTAAAEQVVAEAARQLAAEKAAAANRHGAFSSLAANPPLATTMQLLTGTVLSFGLTIFTRGVPYWLSSVTPLPLRGVKRCHACDPTAHLSGGHPLTCAVLGCAIHFIQTLKGSNNRRCSQGCPRAGINTGSNGRGQESTR